MAICIECIAMRIGLRVWKVLDMMRGSEVVVLCRRGYSHAGVDITVVDANKTSFSSTEKLCSSLLFFENKSDETLKIEKIVVSLTITNGVLNLVL